MHHNPLAHNESFNVAEFTFHTVIIKDPDYPNSLPRSAVEVSDELESCAEIYSQSYLSTSKLTKANFFVGKRSIVSCSRFRAIFESK